MKPPTPAMPYGCDTPDMIAALRLYAGESLFYVDTTTHNALLRRGWIRRDRSHQAVRWALTDAGWRVLAEEDAT